MTIDSAFARLNSAASSLPWYPQALKHANEVQNLINSLDIWCTRMHIYIINFLAIFKFQLINFNDMIMVE